jgi:anti-sigma B factor antagonist
VQMTISSQVADGGSVVLRVSGDLDLASAGKLFDAGLTALNADGCQQLCLDVAGVTFLDSTGLGALIRLRNSAHDAGRDLVICDPPDRVSRLLGLTGLDATFHIVRVKTTAQSHPDGRRLRS